MTASTATTQNLGNNNQSYRKILVAYDGSANAKRALWRAVQLVGRSEGELVVVAAVDTVSFVPSQFGHSYDLVRQQMLDYGKGLLSEAIDSAEHAGVTRAYGSVEEGRPTNMILAKASEIKADLIVVGRRGIRGIERFLIGSVSSGVVGNSECGVLIVK